MSDSILDSTKKILGLPTDYTPFDLDIITHINASFSVLSQLGIGPAEGFSIDGNEPIWNDFAVPAIQRNLVRSWLYLKVRMLFDPPTTSYLITSMNEQIAQFEWRLNIMREDAQQEAV